MKKVLLFGATGSLGKQLADELMTKGYRVTAVVRNEKKQKEMSGRVHHCIVADVTRKSTLAGICDGFEIVMSALGKSVSPNDHSIPSFRQVDLEANTDILAEALRSGVKKFIYVSAIGAGEFSDLEYFRVHHAFSERLIASGLDYAIIKPPALFSAFLDLVQLARKGQLATLGTGERKTNPIDEADLAKICVAAIHQPTVVIEAGGKEVLTRRQINEMIQQQVNPRKKVRQIPFSLVKICLPFVRLFSRNMYHKAAFFVAVSGCDLVAPRIGESKLADYIRHHIESRQTAFCAN